MQNRFVHIILYLTAGCFPLVAIANNPCVQETVAPKAIESKLPCVVREQVSHSKFVRVTFSNDSCDTMCGVNKGIEHFELSEYIKSQTEKLNQMSLEILKVFSEEELEAFNAKKACPIMCELTVLKDGRIANTSLIIPERFSAEISDQKLRDIKDIITNTQLDEIPHNTSAVRFNRGVPRELIDQLL